MTLTYKGLFSSISTFETPPIMHPGTVLSQDAFPTFPTMPNKWYDPLVHPNWPQNAGPIVQAQVPGGCSGCHNARQRGTFSTVDRTMAGPNSYFALCSSKKAIDRTMPP